MTALKTVATVLQVIGLVLLLMGVTNVRKRAVKMLRDVGDGLIASWRLAAERLARLRRRRRVGLGGHLAFDSSLTSDVATASVTRRKVDAETFPVRDWLALLDQRVESLLILQERDQHERESDRRDWDSRFAAARDEIRTEITDATKQGWGFIAWGLGFSLVGTVLGAIG